MSRRWWLWLGCMLALGSAAAPPGELAIRAEDSYAVARAFTYLEALPSSPAWASPRPR